MTANPNNVFSIAEANSSLCSCRREKAGNVTLYFANFSSYKTLNYLGFISENIAWSNDKLPFDVIKKIIANISTDYFTFIITGSYARNKQTDKSDLDVVGNSQNCQK